MLKITPRTNTAGGAAMIALEGQIAGRWVEELRAVLVDTRRAHDTAITLDLKDVTFIDAAGVAFFDEAGPMVTLINCSIFAAEQLKHVIARHQTVRS